MTYQMALGEIRLCAIERPTGWKLVTALGGTYFVTWSIQTANGPTTGKTTATDLNKAIDIFDSILIPE